MALQDRIQPEIRLISPDSDGNQEYIAKWIGNPIRKENKLGLFDAPKIKGTIVQRLEVKSDLYDISIYFDDEDHDLTSGKFWESLDANGKWAVFHPQRGRLDLDFASATWENEYVSSLGFTVFATSWIEGLPDGTEISIAELEQTLNSDANNANISAGEQFENNIKTDNLNQFNAIVGAAQKVLNAIRKNLIKIKNLQLIDPRVESLIRGANDTLSSFPLDTASLVAQFAGIYEAIGLSQPDSSSAVSNFINHANSLDITASDNTENGRNEAAMLELSLSLINAEISKAALLGGIGTRLQAVEIANSINDYFDSMIGRLESIQELFYTTPIELQYIAQSGSLGDQLIANKTAIRYLLKSALDLKIEKIFFTAIPRATIEIAWTELGGPGDIIEADGILIDENYQNFCLWNDLHGDDLILLPAETRVRVFV